MHPLRLLVTILALVAMLIVAAAGSAQGLERAVSTTFDSAGAGHYSGSGYECDIIPTLAPLSGARGVYWDCETTPSDRQVRGAGFVPECPGSYALYILADVDSWPNDSVYARIVSVTPTSINVRFSTDYFTALGGGGGLVAMTRTRSIVAPMPYFCATQAAPPRKGL